MTDDKIQTTGPMVFTNKEPGNVIKPEDQEEKAQEPTQYDYWVNAPKDFIAAELYLRMDNYYRFIKSYSQRLYHWKMNYLQYYSNVMTEGLYKSGVQRQFTNLNVNQFTSIIDTIKTLIVQQRPAFEPQAANEDVKSEDQALLAKGLLDYYMRAKGLEQHMTDAVFDSLLYGEGFIMAEWDTTVGKTLDAAVNADGSWKPTKEGDIKYTNLDPAHVIRDVSKTSSANHDWYIVRTYKNRFELMAEYPDQKDEIFPINPAASDQYKDVRISRNYNYASEYDGDELAVYYFFHKDTSAVPNGRFVKYLNDDVILEDMPLPYKTIPLVRCTPKEYVGTPFGCTPADELRPLQYQLNVLYGMICSKQVSLGLSNILRPMGSNISPAQISGALRIIDFDPKAGKPETLDLNSSSADLYTAVKTIESKMQEISGINSVARGQPEANLKSGAALALLQANAISYNSPLQQSYARLIEGIGTMTIDMLKRYANSQRVITITGKANSSYLEYFTGQDLTQIDNVVVDVGSPLTNTIAGKEQLAETWLQNGMIANPKEYMEVVETGRLDAAVDSTTRQLQCMHSENEALMIGKPVQIMKGDNHKGHIDEHLSLLDSNNMRTDPSMEQNRAAILQHVQEHEQMWIQVSQNEPNLLIARGYPLAQLPNTPPPGAPPAPAAKPAVPASAPAPVNPGIRQPPGAPGAAKTEAKVQQVMKPATAPAMPNLPTQPRNPATGMKGVSPMGAGRNTALSGHTNQKQ